MPKTKQGKKSRKTNKNVLKPTYIEKEPWERLDGESEQAFAAFNTYLDIPMGERTIEAVYEKLSKSKVLLHRWKLRWQWSARVQAYDAAQLEKRRDEVEQDRLKVFQEGYRIGEIFFRVVSRDLQSMLANKMKNPKAGQPGEPDIIPYNEKIIKLSATEKIRLMDWGYRMTVENAAARKLALSDLGTTELQDTAFDAAVDEILLEEPALSDAFSEIFQKALVKAYSTGPKKSGRVDANSK